MGIHICNYCEEQMYCNKAFDNRTNYGQCLHSNKNIRELNENKYSAELKEYKKYYGGI